MGELASQLSRMLHPICPDSCVMEELLLNLIDAALAGHEPTAASDERIHLSKVNFVLVEDVKDHVATVRQLGRDVTDLLELLCVVGDVC